MITTRVIDMACKRPPSRIRYEKKNPVVSARIPLKEKQDLKEILRLHGISQSQYFRRCIRQDKLDHDTAYKNGYHEGIDETMIWYTCGGGCSENIQIVPGSDVHNAIINFLWDKKEFWCQNCLHKEIYRMIKEMEGNRN